MLAIGERFPDFAVKAVVTSNLNDAFIDIHNQSHQDKWRVFFFWPKDFTFVCPTEIAEFNNAFSDFTDRDTILLGASTDSEYVHLAWRKNHHDLKDLQFPMIADTSKSLAEELGILEAKEKIAYRATYIIDNEGIVRWVNINDLSVGRNVAEVVRVLDALQTGELTPCNWVRGEATLS